MGFRGFTAEGLIKGLGSRFLSLSKALEGVDEDIHTVIYISMCTFEAK